MEKEHLAAKLIPLKLYTLTNFLVIILSSPISVVIWKVYTKVVNFVSRKQEGTNGKASL